MSRFKAAAPLVPLLLASAAAIAAPPASHGRVIGPADSPQTLKLLHGMGMRTAAVQPLAGGPACTIYFDATGQAGFNPPAQGTQLTPAIGAANIAAGGVTSFAHGTQATTASASGNALTATVGVIGPNALLPQVTLNTIQGIAYFATATNCTAGSFTTTLQSNPAGTPGPNGTVLAQLGTGPTIAASYTPSYSDQGTYYCDNGFYYYLCEVWQVNVAFNFLTSSFTGNGAGTYTLTINQVTLSSP